MAITNRLKYKLQEVSGRVREAVGRQTRDGRMADRGTRDRWAGNLKARGDHLLDAVRSRRR